LQAKQGGTAEHHGCSFVPGEASNRLSLEATMRRQIARLVATIFKEVQI